MNEDRPEGAGSTVTGRLETYLGEVILEKPKRHDLDDEAHGPTERLLGAMEGSVGSSDATPRDAYTEALIVSEDRVEGAPTYTSGRIESDEREAIGDGKIPSEGLISKASGTAQDLIGSAQDAVRTAVQQASPRVRDSAQRIASVARTNPVVALAAVGAAGLVLGALLGARSRLGAPSARPASGRTQAEIAQEALNLKRMGEPAKFTAS